MLTLLASMWGASYLFIKLAVEDIPPAAMTDIRLWIAGILLAAYLVSRTSARSVVYGAVLLDESISAAALGGLALILTGVILASGQRLLGTTARESTA